MQASDAQRYVAGYALALDMTARNLQDAAKKAGLPWSQAKGYDTFCPVGDLIAKARVPDAQNVQLALRVNGAVRQNGNTSSMIFK